jgi:hypothetical protein
MSGPFPGADLVPFCGPLHASTRHQTLDVSILPANSLTSAAAVMNRTRRSCRHDSR